MSGAKHGSNVIESAQCQISIWAGPKLSTKLTGECESGETGENLKLFGSDYAIVVSIEKLARALHCSKANCGT